MSATYMSLTDEEAELIAKHRAKTFTPKRYTDAEKIAAFDELYKSALTQYYQVKNHGYSHLDASYYIFEKVMKLLGDNVFESYNSYFK